MPRRIRFVLLLDTAMLVLVCVLECLSLTGLDLHVWLGFALCPIVLIHVTLQWQWLITQFKKLPKMGNHRTGISALLNILLLVMMSAVLLSGVFGAPQVTSHIGEWFGRIWLWREIHGWLNFTVLVLVGLHVALNWDWLLVVIRRRGRETAAGARTPGQAGAPATQERPVNLATTCGRGLGVLSAVLLSAGLVYFAMGSLLGPARHRAELQHPKRPPPTAFAPQKQPVPQPRPASVPHGLEQLIVTAGLVVVFVLIGRYLFRLRL